MDSWLIYAFVSTVLTSAAALTTKKTLLKEHAMEFSTVLAILVLIVSLPLFLIIDYTKITLIQIVITFFSSILAAIAFLFIAKAVRHMEITDSTPLLALGPGVTAVLAFIFLGEALTMFQTTGILLLIIGAFILETKSAFNLFSSIKNFKKSKYIHYIFISIILYAVTSILDRLLLFNLDMQPEAMIAITHVFIVISFIIMIHIFHDGFKGINNGLKRAGWLIFLVAVFTLGYRLTYAQAVKITSVALVSSIRRISTLFTIVIGGEMFHEGRMVRKILASIIMIIGAVLIIL